MITVKLLGGARKALGRDQLGIEGERMKMREILQRLDSISSDNSVFDSSNMLVVVNGVELSLLGGLDAEVKDGDIVSVVPVVHGGYY